jgi:hypothetical protein
MAFFLNDSNKTFPRFPIKLGKFSLINFPQSKKETKALEEMKLVMEVFRRHDPKVIIRQHCKLVRSSSSHGHEVYPDESILEGDLLDEKV